MNKLKTGLVIALALGLIPALAMAATLVPSITSPADGATFNIGQTINFTANATGGTAPYSYVWDFGDSNGAFGQNYSKSYSTAGAKTVTLVVTDHVMDHATTTITLNITNGSTTSPLTISNIQVTDITQTSAVIHWTTNRPADSRVIYSTTSHSDISDETGPNFGYSDSTATSDTETKVTEHAVTVSGLTANTQYFFRVISQE